MAPNHQNLDWNERLRTYGRDDWVARAILDARKSYTDIQLAIAAEAEAFVERARKERSIERQAIVHRHQAIHGHRSKVETSRRILIIRNRIEGLELVWCVVRYIGWDGQSPKPDPRYFAIRLGKGGGTDLRQVTKGAHPDEIALLTSHELEARRLRAMWKRATRFGIALRTLGLAKLKALEFAGEGEAGEDD